MPTNLYKPGLPRWLSGKEVPANADVSSIPRSGRSLGGRNGNPLLYCCLENPMDRGAWKAFVHRVSKSWTQLKRLSTRNICFRICIYISLLGYVNGVAKNRTWLVTEQILYTCQEISQVILDVSLIKPKNKSRRYMCIYMCVCMCIRVCVCLTHTHMCLYIGFNNLSKVIYLWLVLLEYKLSFWLFLSVILSYRSLLLLFQNILGLTIYVFFSSYNYTFISVASQGHNWLNLCRCLELTGG